MQTEDYLREPPLRGISVYLVNTLVPHNKNIQIVGTNSQHSRTNPQRNHSFYQLDSCRMPRARSIQVCPVSADSQAHSSLASVHRAEGTNPLLFLLVLLLPASLLASVGHWSRWETVRHSLMQALRIVTAFSIGHSFPLALVAFGLRHLPSRPVEVLIAVSILVSAAHAIYPLFQARRPPSRRSSGLFTVWRLHRL